MTKGTVCFVILLFSNMTKQTVPFVTKQTVPFVRQSPLSHRPV